MTRTINTPSTAPNSARDKLAALIAKRDELRAKEQHLHETANRLAAPQDGVAPIAAELASLNLAEADAMRAWAASGGSDPAPVADVVRRDMLTAALAAANASAEAARQAMLTVNRERTDAAEAANRLEAPIVEGIVDIVADELAPLIAAFDEANRELEKRKKFLGEGYAAIDHLAREAGVRESAPVVRTLDWINGMFHGVGLNLSLGALLAPVNPTSAWVSFREALRSDPAAALELEA